jgi:putative ABC transport system substrate-binding protein
MNRRKFIAALGGAIAAPLARAQALPPKRTLGMLSLDPDPPPELIPYTWPSVALRKLGWYEGTNLVVERRDAAGRLELLEEFAADLVRRQVDAIWAVGGEPAVAAARATRTIPIVFLGVAWPVEQGLIDSIPRPGRNVTGIAWTVGPEVLYKPLQFLKEIAPDVRRLSGIGFPTAARTVDGGTYVPQIVARRDRVMRDMGFEYQHNFVTRTEDFDAAFSAIVASRAQAVFVAGHSMSFREAPRIAKFMNDNGVISFSLAKEYAQAGGLFTYGSDREAIVKDSFRYVDKIFRGAKPADLPIELPSKHELAVNLKTAKLLGLKIPGPVLLLAEHIFE